MKINEGRLDRAMRVALGLALLSLALVGPKTPWGFFGVVPLLTGLTGYCPFYQLFGLSSCAIKPRV